MARIVMVPEVIIPKKIDKYEGSLRGKEGPNALWILRGETEKPTVYYTKNKIEVTVETAWEYEDSSMGDIEKSRHCFDLDDPNIKIEWKEKQIENS